MASDLTVMKKLSVSTHPTDVAVGAPTATSAAAAPPQPRRIFRCFPEIWVLSVDCRLSRRTVANESRWCRSYERENNILANTSVRKIFAASPEFIESYVLQNDKRKKKKLEIVSYKNHAD